MVFPLIYTPPVAPRDFYQDQALDIPAPHGGRGAAWEHREEEEEGLGGAAQSSQTSRPLP